MALFNKNIKKNENAQMYQAHYNVNREIELCEYDVEFGTGVKLVGRFQNVGQYNRYLNENKISTKNVIWGYVSEIDQIVANDNRQYAQKRTYR